MYKIPHRIQTIKNFKGTGGQVAAVLPIHYSRALLRSFDILPVEVWGPPQLRSGKSATHLQAYICSICHNTLSYLQQGSLDIADIILTPHACDSLQGLGSLLLDFIQPYQAVIPLYIPRGKRQTDLEFLAAELHSIYDRLVDITRCKPSDSDLNACIDREEKADHLLARLHQQNRYLPLTNGEIYQIIRSREYLPAEEFIPIAEETLLLSKDKLRPGIPILLEGILPEPSDIFETLTEFNAAVVGDDLACCGRRLYPGSARQNPFERMAESILQAPPDPTRGSSLKNVGISC